MRVLVTGGMGFIGSHFVRLMLSRGHDVVNLDVLSYAANPHTLDDIAEKYPKQYIFIKGDVRSREDVARAMRDIDLVVHFAAESHVDRAIADAGIFIETDVLGTYIVLDEARRRDVAEFIYISTDEVYGSVPEGVYCDESAPLMPRNPYAASKAGADRLAYSFHTTYGMDIRITRSSNNYGPYQHPEKFIPRAITTVLRGGKIPVYGKGENKRDWLFVEDNVRAIEVVAMKGSPGEVYNIGAGNEIRNIDLARMIASMLGREGAIEFVPDRPGHDYRYGLRTEKIRSLGWHPEMGFEDGLRRTVEWYKENEWWWKPLLGE